MKAITFLIVGLVLGALFGAGAVAATPWQFYTVHSLVNTSITYRRGYALGVMDAVGFMDRGGQTATCMLRKARTVNQAYEWSARVWSTTTTITQSAAGALIADATQGCP